MAKKTRRQRRKVSSTRTPPAAQTRNEPAVTAARATKVDLAEEYHYVFADLRRIAIIAAIMFVLLFALAIVL